MLQFTAYKINSLEIVFLSVEAWLDTWFQMIFFARKNIFDLALVPALKLEDEIFYLQSRVCSLSLQIHNLASKLYSFWILQSG